MFKKGRIAATIAAAVVALGVVPSHADKLIYVSGPAGQYTTYTVPVLVIKAGDSVDYTNVDIAAHDVIARNTEPWYQGCAANGAVAPSATDPVGSCPVFWTTLIGLGRTVPIRDIEDEPQGMYDFYCSIHSNMKGILVVV